MPRAESQIHAALIRMVGVALVGPSLLGISGAQSRPELPADLPTEPAQTPATPAAAPPATEIPRLLLVDAAAQPRVSVQWTDNRNTSHTLEGQRPYASDADREPLGENIVCYAALGGSRLTKGAGHPRGAIVRVGFYKADNAKPFFDNATKETEITVTLTGVRFNQPVDVSPDSLVQHLKYERGEMEACGLPGDAREQFNLASPTDTLNDRINPGIDTRLGVLDGSESSLGSTALTVEEDGSVTMRLTFRYPALRNLRDPWKSDLPGTFLEPYHFHAEFEVLPEGVAPLDPDRATRTTTDASEEPAD